MYDKIYDIFIDWIIIYSTLFFSCGANSRQSAKEQRKEFEDTIAMHDRIAHARAQRRAARERENKLLLENHSLLLLQVNLSQNLNPKD